MKRFLNDILRSKVDILMGLLFLIIVSNYTYYQLSSLLIIPILILAYLRLIVKNDFTIVLILMLISRLLMGFLVPGNSIVFNLMNVITNYLPITIYFIINWKKILTINLKNFRHFQFTLFYLIFVYLLCIPNISYALTEFPKEILPLTLFVIVVVVFNKVKINFEYLLRFFRYSFFAVLLVYLLPNFGRNAACLFENPIVFKSGIENLAMYINGNIPRSGGFVFDFRIQGQIGVLYLLLIYYLDKKESYLDFILLFLVSIITFSRGPIIILVLVALPMYWNLAVAFSKRYYPYILGGIILISAITITYIPIDENFEEYISTYSPFNKKNALSQRAKFSEYSIAKFKENPFGNGIGSLSSSKADNVIDFGYADKEKQHRLFYYQVSDAYWALTLGEKGIFGFLLFLLSLFEIFYFRKNYVSLFFLFGLGINLIGTDIPKEGFYYLVFILVYYKLSEKGKLSPNRIN